ncbi:hypothetical protein PT974_09624 [Cladobotryum mycophilum]|uniref:Uncharacterized protein n=1 Tax=Cladobotryum mycophilum TaxID=491253 RepID=A0ABR0SGR4_9HYPO
MAPTALTYIKHRTHTIPKLAIQLVPREEPDTNAHTPRKQTESDYIVFGIACVFFIAAIIAMAFLFCKMIPRGTFSKKLTLLKAKLNSRKFKTLPVTATNQPQGLRYTFEGEDLPRLNYATFEQQKDFAIMPMPQDLPPAYGQDMPSHSPLPSYRDISPTRPPAYELVVNSNLAR